jgi:ATP-dependent DNA ligase
MGLEGIVSKRLGSRYVSGRSKDWLKFKRGIGVAEEAVSQASGLGLRRL